MILVVFSNKTFAYLSGESQSNASLAEPLNYFNKQLVPNLPGLKSLNIGTTAPALSNVSEGILKGFISGTASQQFKLLNTQNLSFNDISGSLKSIAVLAINLFLIVIQTVAATLKALLSFLK